MRHRVPLPDTLGLAFRVADATALGIGVERCRAPDLARPFHGVRAVRKPTTFAETIRCYAPRMLPSHRCVGWTALRLWHLPTPGQWTPKEPIEIAVPRDAAPPRGPRVRGRRLDAARALTWKLGGILTVDPIATLFTTADRLTVDQAVTVIDALITTADNYPNLRSGRPPITVSEIEERLAQWRSFPGSKTIRAALPLARERVESPKETETRLLIVRAGLPEPVVQHEEWDGRRFIARVDLAYPDLKIAIEYEGDGHRRDPEQWRRDIQRQRDLEDRGWIIIRLTQRDLQAGGEAVLTRIRRAIASRQR